MSEIMTHPERRHFFLDAPHSSARFRLLRSLDDFVSRCLSSRAIPAHAVIDEHRTARGEELVHSRFHSVSPLLKDQKTHIQPVLYRHRVLCNTMARVVDIKWTSRQPISTSCRRTSIRPQNPSTSAKHRHRPLRSARTQIPDNDVEEQDLGLAANSLRDGTLPVLPRTV